MTRISTITMVALLLGSVAQPALTQSGYELYQQALVKERSSGQIQEAITLYQRIVSGATTDRALVAKALIQLGHAYETLGKSDASRAYARVLNEFGDQKDQAAEARMRLAALRPTAAHADRPLPVRRLITNTNDVDGTPTHDGRHLLRYNRERRAFELVEIESKQVRSLTADGPAPETITSVRAELSPSGRRLAVKWHRALRSGEPVGPTNTGGAELRVITVGGRGWGEPIQTWQPGINVRIFGWSPKEDRVWVIARRPDLAAEIASVEIAGGSLEVLKTIAWRPFSQAPSLSPDGRVIAYEDASSRDAPHDVFLLASDGSREVRIEHPANDSKPVFAPDGSGVVFDSDRRDGIRDLWFLPVEDGRPAGEPRMVFQDVYPYGDVYRFAKNGSVFFYIATNRWEVYTASVDLAAGRIGDAELLVRLNGEENNAPAYSPDGRYLAHLRSRGRRLVLRDLASGSEREFPIGGSFAFVVSVDWCPNGQAVLVTGFQRTYATTRIDVSRGGAERLPLADPFLTRCLGVGDDVLYAQLIRDPRNPKFRLARRAVTAGTETTLVESGNLEYSSVIRRPSVIRSPDATAIAFVEQDSAEAWLVVMPVAGGAARIVARSPMHQRGREFLHEFVGMMWMPDGNGLLVVRTVGAPSADDASPEVTFWRIPLDGGSPVEAGRMRLPPFESSPEGAFHFSLHPDGSRVAFERHAGFLSQVWAIDNLLPFIQSGARLPLAIPQAR